jgi:hypothetical protein
MNTHTSGDHLIDAVSAGAPPQPTCRIHATPMDRCADCGGMCCNECDEDSAPWVPEWTLP